VNTHWDNLPGTHWILYPSQPLTKARYLSLRVWGLLKMLWLWFCGLYGKEYQSGLLCWSQLFLKYLRLLHI